MSRPARASTPTRTANPVSRPTSAKPQAGASQRPVSAHGSAAAGHASASRPSTAKNTLSPAAKRIVEKIKMVVTQRCGGNALRGLARIFRAMDNSGDMSLDREEFRWGLQDYGIHLTNEEFTALWIGFDRDNSGSINFDEFLAAVRGDMSATRKKWVLKAYQKLDRDGSGMVNIDDIRGVYKADKHPKVLSGERTEAQILNEFLAGFEKYGDVDGQVTIDEFTMYYQDVSNSIDSDDYFIQMICAAWQLKE